MKRLSVLMLLVGLFLAGIGVQAGRSCCPSKKITSTQKAAKYKKYAENYKKMAAKMLAKGDKKKAAYYTKLAAAKLKMAKAYETNDLKALKAAQAEYQKLKKCYGCKKTEECAKTKKCQGCTKTKSCKK